MHFQLSLLYYRDRHYWGRLACNHKAVFRFYLLWGFSAADSWSWSEVKSDIDVRSGYAIDSIFLLNHGAQKSSVGMYGVCDYPYDKSVLFDPVIPTSSFKCFCLSFCQWYCQCWYVFYMNQSEIKGMACIWHVTMNHCARACSCKYKYALTQLCACWMQLLQSTPCCARYLTLL